MPHPETDYYSNPKGALREITKENFLVNKKKITERIFGGQELDKGVHEAFSNFLRVQNSVTAVELVKRLGMTYGGLTAVVGVAVVFFLFLIVIIVWS